MTRIKIGLGLLFISTVLLAQDRAIKMNLVGKSNELRTQAYRSVFLVDGKTKAEHPAIVEDLFTCDFSKQGGRNITATVDRSTRKLVLQLDDNKDLLSCTQSRLPTGNGLLCESSDHTVLLTETASADRYAGELWSHQPLHQVQSTFCFKKK